MGLVWVPLSRWKDDLVGVDWAECPKLKTPQAAFGPVRWRREVIKKETANKMKEI